MELDQLRERLLELREHDVADVDTLYREYTAETGSEDTVDFVGWLRARGDLSLAGFIDVHASAPIRTSQPGLDSDDNTGRYVLLGLVGKGGSAEIHLARDEVLGRNVAVKVLRKKRKGNRLRLRRFVDEAQITAQLEHPNIVPVYGLDRGDEDAFSYAMKLIRGDTLTAAMAADREAAGADPSAEASALPRRLEQFVKVCDAMAYAHARGVIHRDLKPDNIMLGRWGEVYVMDWGLAKVVKQRETSDGDADDAEDTPPKNPLTAQDDRTRQGQMLGTPRYMAPEQALGHLDEMDARSDVASLGVILYELVTLQKARDMEDFVELLKAARAGGIGPMKHAIAGVRLPPELSAVIDKACAPKKEDRYRDAGALGDDVRRYLRNEAVTAAPDPPIQRLMRTMSRHRQATLSVLAVLLLAVAGLVIAGLVRQQAAAEQALHREERLSAFLSRVGHRAGRIDTYFFGVQNRLTRFATATRELMLHGRVSEDPVYLALEYKDATKRPPGLIPSPRYHADVSLSWVDFSLPEGMSRDDARERMKTLSPLRHTLRDVLLSSRALSERTASLDEAEAEKYAAQHGLPIDRCYFGSADGMNVEMPGQYWDARGFDPRVRPWYKLADHKRGFHWGNPFVEIATEALLISCSTGVWSETNAFLGVAGVGIAVRYLVTELLDIADEPAVVATFLIDDEGRIVVASSDANRQVKLGRLDRGEALLPYPHRDALGATDGAGGVARIERDGEVFLLVHRPLHASGWRYVVEARYDDLLR